MRLEFLLSLSALKFQAPHLVLFYFQNYYYLNFRNLYFDKNKMMNPL